MHLWPEELADRKARQLREDGAPRTSAKLVFISNTSTDMVDVVWQFGDVADVAVPTSQASLQSPPVFMLIQLSRTSPTKGSSTHSILPSVIPISPLTTTTEPLLVPLQGMPMDACLVLQATQHVNMIFVSEWMTCRSTALQS